MKLLVAFKKAVGKYPKSEFSSIVQQLVNAIETRRRVRAAMYKNLYRKLAAELRIIELKLNKDKSERIKELHTSTQKQLIEVLEHLSE